MINERCRKSLVCLLCLSLLFLSIGCQRKGIDENDILAKIDNQIITIGEFNSELSKAELGDMGLNAKDRKSLAGLKEGFLNSLIEKKILLMEAQRLDIRVTREELDTKISLVKKGYTEDSFKETLINECVTYDDWEERIRMKLLMEKLIKKVILSNISIEDEEVKKYYEAHLENYLIPRQIRARQIVVATDAEAKEILKRLNTGESFIELAKEKSLSPDSIQGGDLGYFSRGEMPVEFDEVVFSLPLKKLSNVVKSPYGFHIFRVEEKKKAKKVFLTEARDQIEEKLIQGKAEQEYDRWLRMIKSKIKIEINEQLLEETD